MEFYSKHITKSEIEKKINYYWVLSDKLVNVIEDRYIKLRTLEKRFRNYNKIEQLYLYDWYKKIVIDKRIVTIPKNKSYSCIYYLNIDEEILITYKALVKTNHIRVYEPLMVFTRKLTEYNVSKSDAFLYLQEDIEMYEKKKEAEAVIPELREEMERLSEERERKYAECKKLYKERSKEFQRNELAQEKIKLPVKGSNYEKAVERNNSIKAKIYTCEVCGGKYSESERGTYIVNTKIGKCKKCFYSK